MLNTVNVIEFSEGEILGLASYNDDKEGNAQAEERFMSLLDENTGLRSRKAKYAALDEGWFEDGTWKVVIFHSTVGVKA
jgi:hypothetical protein